MNFNKSVGSTMLLALYVKTQLTAQSAQASGPTPQLWQIKLLLVGVIAVGIGLWRFLSGRKQD